MLPQDAVIKYWLRVRELLQDPGSLTDQQADQGIRDYVALAEAHGFTEAIYHRNEEEIAEIIRYGVENESFPEPADASKASGRKSSRGGVGKRVRRNEGRSDLSGKGVKATS